MKKLSEDHYILMDDSEINIGDIVAEKLLTGEYELFTIHTLNDIDKSTQKKITHSTQPLGFLNEVGLTTANLKPDWTNVEFLPLSEVKELLGVVDVEKSMWYERNLQNPYPLDSPSNTGFNKGFELGYNQALEDNKEKKWTDEDVIKIVEKSRQTGLTAEYIILSLQPKTEWEVEFVDGKLKLKS